MPPTNASDAEMTALDWILAILCGLIGCIVAIVYIAQGKPKGTKMLIVNIIAIVVGNVIYFVGMMALAPKQ